MKEFESMNFISKVKKIAICGVASLGMLVSVGNIGLSAMYPFQFSGFNMTNHGNDFTGFSGQYSSQFSQNVDEDNFMDVEEEPQPTVYQEHSHQPQFIQINNIYNNFQTGMSPNVPNMGVSTQTPISTTPFNVASRTDETLSAISARGRLVRELSNREKIELTRRGIALRENGKTWVEISALLGILQSTLKNWVDLYKGVSVIRYNLEEKRAHVHNYLNEHRTYNVTPADYSERHGLIVSTFKKWLSDYEKGLL